MTKTKIFISNQIPKTFDLAGYEALDFYEVSEAVNVYEISQPEMPVITWGRGNENGVINYDNNRLRICTLSGFEFSIDAIFDNSLDLMLNGGFKAITLTVDGHVIKCKVKSTSRIIRSRKAVNIVFIVL